MHNGIIQLINSTHEFICLYVYMSTSHIYFYMKLHVSGLLIWKAVLCQYDVNRKWGYVNSVTFRYGVFHKSNRRFGMFSKKWYIGMQNILLFKVSRRIQVVQKICISNLIR